MSCADLDHLREAAEQIISDASYLPMKYFRSPLSVDSKSDESPVTIADRETEAFIRKRLQAEFPGHGIFGEEEGVSGSLEESLWIIDPIDGTRSFISGHPLFGMLLGYLEQGKPKIGLVRMPFLDETYVGVSGKGAWLNGEAIQCRDTVGLDNAIVYINEADRIQAADSSLFSRICSVGHTRRMSYDCYAHAMVASGLIDVSFDFGLAPYDYLPLVSLIEGAGGLITDWDGEPLTLNSDGRVVVACNPAIHADALALIRN